MSGIAGVVDFDEKPVEHGLIENMISTMAHRGPDGRGFWVKGSVALGHCMLHTTPESLQEKQPLTNEDESLVLVMDGRVDNRDDLVNQLRGKSFALRDNSDPELVLRAYEAWGDACPEHILGDFAFAVWNARKKTLFCARDHFGVKPFYYHCSDKLFAFATETKGLLANPAIPRRLNEARVADYLVDYLEGVDKTCTFYLDIWRLPPAHILKVAAKQVRLHTYWELQPHEELRLKSDADYEAAFLDIFTSAVACRLRSATPPASMLSGGLDSSSIVGVARQLLSNQTPLLTFSAVSRNLDCTETQLIEAVLELDGLQPTRVYPDEIESFLEDLDAFENQQDEPFDTWMILPQLMYAASRRQGCKMLLDGVPGDEVASLPGQFIAGLLRQGKGLRACSEAAGMARFYEAFGYSTWRVLKGNMRSAVIPNWARRLRRQLSGPAMARQVATKSMMKQGFAKRIDLFARLERLIASTRTPITADLQFLHAQALDSAYLTVGLERYDRVAGVYGVEPRHPLLDKRLVDYCLALPWSQKIRTGWTKHIMRRTSRGLIPYDVRWRTGRDHLGWQFHERHIFLKKKKLEDFLLRELAKLVDFVDIVAVQKAFCDEQLNPGYGKIESLWHIAALAWWLDGHDHLSGSL